MKINKDIKTFYINLNDNLDRKKNMKNLLNKYEFSNYQRFDAVNTKSYQKLLDNTQIYSNIFNKEIISEYDLTSLKNKKKRKAHSELSLGAVGCYLSHISIYKKIIEENIPYVLILEDDINITTSKDKFWNKINQIKIPEDTDIFLFDYVLLDYIKTEIEYIYKINFFFGLHFYLITLEGAKKCLELLLPITMQIDSKLSRLSYLNLIKIYGYNKFDLNIYQHKLLYNSNIQIDCINCKLIDEIISFKKDNSHIIKIYGNINKILYINYILFSYYFYLFIIIILFYIIYKLNYITGLRI